MHYRKGQKLVKIVELMQRRGGIRAHEIMGRFDLDARSFRRYMSDLRDLGLPILDDGTGGERIVALDPSYRRSGVQLTLSEVLSLHFGRKLFTFLNGTQFAADMDDAIERLEPAISRAHADLALHLDRKFMAVPEHAKDYTEMADLIDELITALIYDNPLHAEYTKASGVKSSYVLEPLTLATYRQGLYLFARDRKDQRIKSFAVERFQDLCRVRTERFEAPDGFDPKDLLKNAFGIISGEPVKVSAVFDSRAAPYIRERSWHPSQRLDELADGRIRMTAHLALSQEVVQWLLGFGGDVRVEGPPELVDRLREHHKKALEKLA
jgi:predicted DNA-binding transcriptional regulator YafY